MDNVYPEELTSTGRWRTKLGLRITAAVLWMIALILLAKPASTGNYLPIIMLCAPAGASFLWDVAESICLLVRNNRRGIHPGACVGVDLILLLASIIVIVITGVLWTAWTNEEYPTDQKEADEVRSFTTGALVLGGFATIIRFCLFVMACIETHKYNKAVKRAFAATAKVQDA
ncbi:hypothetical protein VFPFJ_08405 [Purpureocillium lilacinum]|uniref:MARVEL domain-containing protein n=2 Tax=Purpureocillium lilacinum TaxID=33203 RepID=A0A179GXU2_PURLI|nr:hypothetical protein VFPFJ_08405 [Purpureocillium lilacinum]KAK4084763.1 hypothetical protein Purlil1_10169 [Purpureocillium lilacinum]OAQ82602.1 hypothetical protein VFPFJ_08405 [Purpureocillium lilacinum]